MKRAIAGILTGLLIFIMAACSPAEERMLTGLVFDRGHGSVWGNQFYIALTPAQITSLRYIPQGTGDLQFEENIPITPEQWQEIAETVDSMVLEQERIPFWKRLLGNRKLDGGEYRHLTLQWQTEKGTEQIRYLWPGDEQSAILEALLERMILTQEADT